MEILVLSLFLVGLGLAGLGAIWTMVISFTEHIFWGVGYICLPLIGALLFMMMKWNLRSVRRSIFMQISGLILMLTSALIIIVQNWSFQATIARWIPKRILPNSATQVTVNYPMELEVATTTDSISSARISSTTIQPDEPLISLNSYASRSQFRRYMEVGYHAFDAGDYHTALINFQQALKERPDNAYALQAIDNTTKRISDRTYTNSMNAGYQAFDRQQYAIALQYFEKALEQRPNDPYALKAIDIVNSI